MKKALRPARRLRHRETDLLVSRMFPESFRLTFRAQLLLGFGAVLLVSATVSALAYRNTLNYRDATIWVRHTEQVIASAQVAHLTVQSLDESFDKWKPRDRC